MFGVGHGFQAHAGRILAAHELREVPGALAVTDHADVDEGHTNFSS